ncbi:YoaK family protein [uncultured Anaerofustis sp.]|uniref:YoaK family protein n=1 Tax=uncultured Anaerofustis sp. TaxID=904996 RepID=UPI0025E811DC|nr:YoaK family protein [uncultured Anaerofustis sp.]
MTRKKQMSETYIIGMILAIVGGFLDAYTYISRGKVFANAQTGNIVLLGVNFAEGEFKEAAFYLLPIIAFFVGIIGAEMIKKRHKYNENIHWRQIVIIIEIVTLLIVGFIPSGRFDMLSNILISFVCSLQVESFRKVNGNAYATTMCTGNLRSATEHLYNYKQTKDKRILKNSLQYYGIILFFIVGALIGSLLTHLFFVKAVLFSLIGLIAVFILMFIEEVEVKNNNKKRV